MDRLIKSTTNNKVTEYTYDELGNLKQREYQSDSGKLLKIKYEYNQETNQLLSSTSDTNSVKLEYDKIGNVTTKKYQSGLKEEFKYDSNYNLIEVSNNIGVTTTYAYDAFDNRVSKTENIESDSEDTFGFLALNDGNNNFSSKLKSNDVVTDLQNLSDNLEERSALYDDTCPKLVNANSNSSSSTTEYVINSSQYYPKNLMTIDPTTETVIDTYVYDNDSNLELNRDDYYNVLHYESDGLGNVVANTQSDKRQVKKYGYVKNISYDDFGQPTKYVSNNYGYNQELHSSNDTQYLRYREYNTQNARFEEIDSFLGTTSSSQSQNRYAYTENNPVNKIDPSGNKGRFKGFLKTAATTAIGAVSGAYNGARESYNQSKKNGDGLLKSLYNTAKGTVAGAAAGARSGYDVGMTDGTLRDAWNIGGAAGREAGRNVANGQSITDSAKTGYHSTQTERNELARQAAEQKKQQIEDETKEIISDPENNQLYKQILTEHPNMSPEEVLKLLKHCIKLGLKEYTPEAYKIAKDKEKKASIINTIDTILGLVGMVTSVAGGDALFDMASIFLMMKIPDAFGAVTAAIALAVPFLTSSAAKALGGIKNILKKVPNLKPSTVINTAETLKVQLFSVLRNLADLPIAKAIRSKIRPAIDYLDNLASRFTDAVQRVFKQADSQFDDVADEAAESLSKQTDEIAPPVTVCVPSRSSRIGFSTRACNGNGLVGEEIAKKLDNMKFPSKDELLDGVTNQKLKTHITSLYRDGATVGDGSTFAAVVSELKTGNTVGGKFHLQKMKEIQSGLEKLLKHTGNLNPGHEHFQLTSADKKIIEKMLPIVNALCDYIK